MIKQGFGEKNISAKGYNLALSFFFLTFILIGKIYREGETEKSSTCGSLPKWSQHPDGRARGSRALVGHLPRHKSGRLDGRASPGHGG